MTGGQTDRQTSGQTDGQTLKMKGGKVKEFSKDDGYQHQKVGRKKKSTLVVL